jgi:hypothetical protein
MKSNFYPHLLNKIIFRRLNLVLLGGTSFWWRIGQKGSTGYDKKKLQIKKLCTAAIDTDNPQQRTH